jgi:hypothetical protein
MCYQKYFIIKLGFILYSSLFYEKFCDGKWNSTELKENLLVKNVF